MLNKLSHCSLLLAVSLVGVPQAIGQDGDVGHLRTRISPAVAGVFVDGEYYGTAAMFGSLDGAIGLKPGNYTVKIVDPRYRTLEAKITIKKGEYTTVRQKLTPVSYEPEGPLGELKAHGFGNAAVYLNGKYYANTKELQASLRTLLLKPGTYQLKIVGVDGKTDHDEKVKINADEVLVVYKRGATVRRK